MFSKSENYFKQFQVREFAFSPFLASIFYYKEGHDPDLGLSIIHEVGYLQIFCSSSRAKNTSSLKLCYFFYKCFGQFGVCHLKTTKMAVRLIKILGDDKCKPKTISLIVQVVIFPSVTPTYRKGSTSTSYSGYYNDYKNNRNNDSNNNGSISN